jgi:F0F1-type ATP synthase membrane subunit c/vacuolar-type H+-ATPase subunit K
VVVGFLSDDATYLLMAETYSPWIKETSAVLEFLRFQYQFPPLYPVFLGIMGVDTDALQLASIVTVSFLLAAFLIAGGWVWVETHQYFLSISIPILLALLPGSLLFSQGLYSEFLFMCFIYAAFACLGNKKISEQNWLGAALLIGLACLTRSIGIVLVAAFFLFLVIHRPKKKIIYFLISVLPLTRQVASADHTYWQIIQNQLTGNSLTQLLEFIYQQLIVMAKSWYWLFAVLDHSGTYHYLTIVIASIFLMIFLIGFIIRLKQKKFDALCLPVYLVVILVWPFTGVYFVSRFLYPLLPLILFYCYTGIKPLTKTPTQFLSALCMQLLMLGIIAFPASHQFINRAYMSTDTDLMPYRRHQDWLLADTNEQALQSLVYTRELIHILKDIAVTIPESECIYTFQTPIVMLHAQRLAGALPAPDLSDEEFNLATTDCRFFLATYFKDSAGVYPQYYPQQRLDGKTNYQISPLYPRQKNFNQPVAILIERTN